MMRAWTYRCRRRGYSISLSIVDSSAFNGMNSMAGFGNGMVAQHLVGGHHAVAAMTPVTPVASASTAPMTHGVAVASAGASCVGLVQQQQQQQQQQQHDQQQQQQQQQQQRDAVTSWRAGSGAGAAGGYETHSSAYQHHHQHHHHHHHRHMSGEPAHNVMVGPVAVSSSAMASATHSYHQSMNGAIQYASHNSHNSTGTSSSALTIHFQATRQATRKKKVSNDEN